MRSRRFNFRSRPLRDAYRYCAITGFAHSATSSKTNGQLDRSFKMSSLAVLETGGEPLETRLYRVFAFSPASPKERKTPLDGVSLGDWATVANTATGARRPLQESKTGVLKAVSARSANLMSYHAHGSYDSRRPCCHHAIAMLSRAKAFFTASERSLRS